MSETARGHDHASSALGHMRAIPQVFAFDLASKVLLGLVGIGLIRYMSPGEYGRYSVIQSTATLGAMCVNAATNRLYVLGRKGLVAEGDPTPFVTYQLSIVGALALAGLPFAAISPSGYCLTILLATAASIAEFAKTYFQAECRFGSFTRTELLRSSLFAVAVACLLHFAGNEATAVEVSVAQSTSLLLAFLLLLGSKINGRTLLSLGPAVQIARTVASSDYRFLLGYSFTLALSSQQGIIVMRVLSDERNLASYAAAARYYSLLLLSIGAVHAVLFPAIQSIATQQEWARVCAKLRQLWYIFTPPVLLAIVFAGWALPLLDGGKYPASVDTFRVLALSSVVSLAFSPHANLVMKCGGYRFLFYSSLGSTILAIVVNVAFIPIYGPIAAACSTLLSFGLSNYLASRQATRLARTLPPGSGPEPH